MVNNGKLGTIVGNSGITFKNTMTGSNSSNQITLGQGILGISGSNNINVFSFPEEEQSSKYFKKYEIYESAEDLLVLSCAWYRLRKESKENNKSCNIGKLLERQLFSSVTEEDRVLAASIRDYYSKKIMMMKLKNQRISSFTEDLNSFIHSDGIKFIESTFGLVYRLPQFYFYDIKLDEIFSGKNRTVKKGIIGKEIKSLTYIDKTIMDRKACKRNEYWFVDESNDVVVVYLDTKNPLNEIWEQLIQQPIKLQGLYYNKQKGDMAFYQIEKYDLVI